MNEPIELPESLLYALHERLRKMGFTVLVSFNDDEDSLAYSYTKKRGLLVLKILNTDKIRKEQADK